MSRFRIRPPLKSLQRFARSQDGSILPMVAILLTIMIVIAGAGVDYGRAIMVRSALANALDAAVLNVSKELSVTALSTNQVSAKLKAAFEANLGSTGVTDVEIGDVTFVLDADKGEITANTTAEIKTNFVLLGGIGPETIPVAVSSQSTYSSYDIELALVLDVTGSMVTDPSDLKALKTSAQQLVDILIPAGTTTSKSKVRISMVPYSQGVNLGSYAATVSNSQASKNCVTERVGTEQFTDAAYNYAGSSSEYFGGGSSRCPSSSQLIPMTSNRTTLTTAITNLAADGSTAGQTGIAWGWYTLSPNWSNLWPTDSQATAYNTEDVLKFAIIMTDGDFNTYYEKCTGSWTWSRGKWVYVSPSCVWQAQAQNYPPYTYPTFERSKALCDNMKAKGIQIYSIYFDTSGSVYGPDIMKYCASSSSYYYSADSTEELKSAFSNIAAKIQSIRLSK
jgi:Flp pilus assembly protein TadG